MAEETAPNPTKGTVATIKTYFGLKEGQKLTDFAAEFKQLSDEEKLQLSNGIKDESFTY